MFNLKDQQIAREQIGFCLQQNVIYDTLTTRDHLEIIARIRKIPEELREKQVPM